VDTGRDDVDSRVVHEPVGVCGLVTPWNYPLLQTAWKAAPARGGQHLRAQEPSELTPHTAIHLMRLLAEAGLPPGALTAVFLHSGQVCSAGARLLVEDGLHDRFVDEVVRRAKTIRLGGPFDDRAQTGPLISAAHRAKVEACVARGVAEGAVLRCGGSRPDRPDLADGFCYLPTVLDECTAGMSMVREESSGPVLTVERLSSEEEA
jgi:acyl-CoA reductase-like NAD-dependent aldehyde dehydrogenase